MALYGSAAGGSDNRGHHCAFLLADNEVLRAEDPYAQRVLRGVWRAARLSERIHAEGIREEEEEEEGEKQTV